MIELDSITKTYTKGTVTTQVLKGISFRIEAGEYTSIMGTSGTGKSTLMNILGCLDKPTAGHYRLDGIDMINLDDTALSRLRNRKIGFVFQQFHLLDRTTALRNVMLPLIYAEHYPHDAEDRAKKALEAVGLADRIMHRPAELSGGQQQRVAIARALITDPEIILADEPTGNLDERSGLEIMAVFKHLHGSHKTIIMVTHSQEIAEHADRIIVIKDGLVAFDRKTAKSRHSETELQKIAEADKEGRK